MTDVESAKAALEARTELKAEPAVRTTHGDPLARYLGAVVYKDTHDNEHEADDKAE